MPAYIDFSDFTAAKNFFERNPGLCNLFKLLSIETWKRLEFTYIKPKIRVYETTLTQNIAFTINSYVREYPNLLIDVWESDDESANGNDLELEIIFSTYGFAFYAPIQAKKIYRNGTYLAMEHGDQIEKLITYAENKDAYPLYLLYNYLDPITPDLSPHNELFGCSIVDAYYLRDNFYNQRVKKKRNGARELAWNIPRFEDLHPRHAFPWHELVCDVDNNPLLMVNRLLKVSDSFEKLVSDRQDLTLADFENHWQEYPGFIDKNSLSFQGWYKSTDKEIIKDKDDNYYKNMQRSQNKKKEYFFNPQTRIVITV
ncbi:MAG TPA: DUF6615 family protein [Chitinophagaceae bacterium]|nr:DUF6615 family protein [Chitinophagaceae bacterium]